MNLHEAIMNVLREKATPLTPVPKDLFNVSSGVRKLPVSISAVVGKNGSGKSSLMELLYLVIYNASVKANILEFDEDGEAVKLQIGLAAETVYSVNDDMYVLKTVFTNNTEEVNVTKFSKTTDGGQFISIKVMEQADEIVRALFFYTISISYSVYGLNSRRGGDWIKSLFRKNDGYQTPIVIKNHNSLKNIKGINICFSTHSPFILSNIPSRNVLFFLTIMATQKKIGCWQITNNWRTSTVCAR